MKPFSHHTGRSWSRVLLLFLLGAALISAAPAWGVESPGLELEIYPAVTGKYEYELGEPIPLILVIKYNDAGKKDVITDRGFSSLALHEFLKITEPCASPCPSKVIHSFFAGQRGHVMLTPFPWDDKFWNFAESLSEGFVISETVQDLTELLPLMKETTGWWTIGLEIPFVRYDEEDINRDLEEQQGLLLADVESEKSWPGDQDPDHIASSELQIFVSPGFGAGLQVQVLGEGSQPLAQVPVRMFKDSDIPAGSELKDTWLQSEPVLSGTTNFQGMATWDSGGPCTSRDDYTAIAYHKGEYRDAAFRTGDPGWVEADCSGLIAREILFAEEVGYPISQFSVAAANSIWMGIQAVVNSGNVGVKFDQGPWLDQEVELVVGYRAKAKDGTKIFADSIILVKKASVYDVFYNQLLNKGTIRGQALQGLEMPLPIEFPEFPQISAGSQPIEVKPREVVELIPGSYGDVLVRRKGTLVLTEQGVYHFRSLRLEGYWWKNVAELVCRQPADIRIEGRLHTGRNAFIGPEPGSGTTPKDIVIYVDGINGLHGRLHRDPRAARIGANNTIGANIYARNGTLWIGARTKATGSFLARDVRIGWKAQIWLDSAF